jgi:tRNA threonylcarbamoyladenosine biosynthesis protein TsaE
VIAVINLPDEAATAGLATRLAALARRGDIIALSGDLGTGKTVFARAFIRTRLRRNEEVPSPTFTLVQIYEAPEAAIWHFDLYRLTAPDEAWELGIEEAFAAAIALIEWPDRLGPLLPPGRLDLTLEFGEEAGARRVVVTAAGEWATRLAGLAPDG